MVGTPSSSDSSIEVLSGEYSQGFYPNSSSSFYLDYSGSFSIDEESKEVMEE